MKPARAPQRPHDARVLVVDSRGNLYHDARSRLHGYLDRGDLLVANDAATLPASLAGVHERTGLDVEVRLAGRPTLDVERVRDFIAVVFGAGDYRTRTEDRPPPPPLIGGDILRLGSLRATVRRALAHERLVALRFAGHADAIWEGLARHGRPIQYAHIERALTLQDVSTRIAAIPAAYEAPSAGYVLDWTMLDALGARGVDFATVTHAAGISSTGDPALDARLPFDEPYHIPPRTATAIATARARGGRVIALGTTVTRALEHAASRPGGLRAGPGLATQRMGRHSALRVVDGIVTGTHEPGDSHHELLRAFADDGVLRAISLALENGGYRSHEYGDSLFLSRQVAEPRVWSPGRGSSDSKRVVAAR